VGSRALFAVLSYRCLALPVAVSGLLLGGETRTRPRARPTVPNRSRLVFSSLVASLALLLPIFEIALSEENVNVWVHPIPDETYLDQVVYGIPYAPYSDQSLDFADGANAHISEWGSPRPVGSYGIHSYSVPRPDSVHDPIPGAGNPSNASFRNGAGYRWGGVWPSAEADAPAYGYPIRGGPAVGSPPLSTNGYHFRGDVPKNVDVRGWDVPSWRQGYRFRPWTDQERRRMDAGTRWRPRPPDPFWERPPLTGPSPPDETYGYQIPAWLDPYDGARR
jgi:hypothetical protein